MSAFIKLHSKLTIRQFNNVLILLLISVAAVITVNPMSLVSFSLFLLLTSFLGMIFFEGEEQYNIFLLFCFYTILAIVIFWFQYWQFPQNGGSTGEGIYGGTDDLFFFQEATNNGISYRGDRSSFMHNYSGFLQFFSNIVKLYKTPERLDLLFVNILALTYIPIFTRRVAEGLNFSVSSAKVAFYSSSVCPIMIINGLILIRDGWTSLLLILSIYFIINRKLLFVAFAILIAFYFRAGSGVIIMLFSSVILIFTGRDEIKAFSRKRKLLFFCLIILAVVIAIPPVIYFLKTYGLYDTIIRENMMGYISSSGSNKSAAGFFYTMPAPLRIVFGSFYYFGSPFLSFDGLFYNNFITIRSLINMFFPVLFVLYFTLFLQFLGLYIKMDKSKLISLLFISFLVSIVLLSQLSIQPKHKTILMPVFYLIVAYGYHNKNKNSFQIALFISSMMFILEVVYNII